MFIYRPQFIAGIKSGLRSDIAEHLTIRYICMLSVFFTKLLLKLLWLRYNYPYKIEIMFTYLGNLITLCYNEA